MDECISRTDTSMNTAARSAREVNVQVKATKPTTPRQKDDERAQKSLGSKQRKSDGKTDTSMGSISEARPSMARVI